MREFLKNGVEDLRLKVLKLSSNRIASMEKLELEKLTKLETLFLNDNFISSINSIHFPPKLQELILDGNFIRRIDLRTFQFSPLLRELRLDDNLIENLNFLSPLDGLRSLHLGRNRISHVSELDQLSKLTRLVEFVIWRNPLCRKRIYREIAVTKCETLRRIDDREVTPQERSIANGWRQLENATTAIKTKIWPMMV